MKTSTSHSLLIASAVALCAFIVTSAHADTFGSGGNAFTIDFVNIGNPGNPNDSGTTGAYFSPYGGVAYEYRMGKYEISEGMIDKANTLGGLLIIKDTRGVNKPATTVSWNEAARFVNWLNTSQGYAPAYKFALNPGDAGYTTNHLHANADIELWTPSDAGYDAGNLYRSNAAHYFLPSEREWYKAAYYSGSGTTYYDYATGSDTIPTAVASGTGTGTAVYNQPLVPADITQAGGLSAYGTMGQNGNVWEWQESAIDGVNDRYADARAVRGGLWANYEGSLRASFRSEQYPGHTADGFGFRVASVVPEPSSIALLALAAVGLASRRNRQACAG